MNDNHPMTQPEIVYSEQIMLLMNMLMVQVQLKKEHRLESIAGNRANLLTQMGVIDGMSQRYGFMNVEDLKAEDIINEISAAELPQPLPQHPPLQPFGEAAYRLGVQRGLKKDISKFSSLRLALGRR